MSLLATLRARKQNREVATLTVATGATHEGTNAPTVARVASVTVASPEIRQWAAANDPSEVEHELIDERAAIMEYDGGMERPQAERLALLHSTYLMHHWKCKACCAAGQGRGDRCAHGIDLRAAYDLEATP